MKHMINRILEKLKHSQSGSATIEAVVSFTGFLFVIFTILNIVNLCRAQMLVFNALGSAASSSEEEIRGLNKTACRRAALPVMASRRCC